MNRCLHRTGGPRVHEFETNLDAYPWAPIRRLAWTLRYYRWNVVLDGRVVHHGRTWTRRAAQRQQLAAVKHLRFLSVIDPELTELVPA